jgi:polysaccharide export outer membrane protein
MLTILCACGTNKRIVYFNDLQDSAKVKSIVQQPYKEPQIQADDILSITIQTIDPSNSANINQVTAMPITGSSLTSSSSMGATGTQVNGFLVDKDGFVELPMLGKIKMVGLTTMQAREIVRQKAAIYFKEPTVQVRFANFKITVLGEVDKPGPYIIPNEKVSILDAIGLAGDLTVFGKRENVLLIRDNNGKKEFYRFNLNSTESLKSPAFYLQQNDIVYVEGNKAKAATLNAARTQTLTLIAAIIPVLVLFISRL